MWEDILGHARNKDFLQRFLMTAARPHALLFIGAEGLGKKQLAFQFAKSFLCFAKKGDDGCDSCRLLNFEDGNTGHPDFIFVEPEEGSRNIKIEQIKELIKQAAFAPVLSDNRICIIDGADKFTDEAANSFLKLLEEPPEGWLIILLAEKEEAVLQTILSRVVRLHFSPVPLDEVQEALENAFGVPAGESGVLARISEGAIGTALTLSGQEVFSFRKSALDFIKALPLASPENYLASSGLTDLNLQRDDAFLLVRLWQLLFRDMLILREGLPGGLYNCDLEEDLKDLAGKWQAQEIRKALDAVNEAYRALDSNAGGRLVIEAMALKIDKFRKE